MQKALSTSKGCSNGVCTLSRHGYIHVASRNRTPALHSAAQNACSNKQSTKGRALSQECLQGQRIQLMSESIRALRVLILPLFPIGETNLLYGRALARTAGYGRLLRTLTTLDVHWYAAERSKTARAAAALMLKVMNRAPTPCHRVSTTAGLIIRAALGVCTVNVANRVHVTHANVSTVFATALTEMPHAGKTSADTTDVPDLGCSQ